jgi:hypothetical protein
VFSAATVGSAPNIKLDGEASAIADSRCIYVMDHGRIIFEGTPAYFLAAPPAQRQWLEVWGPLDPGAGQCRCRAAVTSDSFSFRASRMICRAADGNGRRYCIGPTTAGNCRETSRTSVAHADGQGGNLVEEAAIRAAAALCDSASWSAMKLHQ